MRDKQKLVAICWKGSSKDLRKRAEAIWLKWARQTNLTPDAILHTLKRWRRSQMHILVDIEDLLNSNGENGRPRYED